MKRAVVLDLLTASGLTSISSRTDEIEVPEDGSDEFPAAAVLEAWLQSGEYTPIETCRTLEAYLAWRKRGGESGKFEDAFTVFQMANITTITFFDMDNEIFILVARDPIHATS